MVAKIRKIKKAGNFRNILSQILVVVVLFGVISFLVVSNLRINQKRSELLSQREELEKQIQLLEERKRLLEAGLSDTEKESYWEGRAREQGYIKEGEEAVVILPAEEGTKESVEEPKNFWQRLMEKLGF